MFNLLTKLRLRTALSKAATQSAPVLQPAVQHVERQVQGTGRDWKASPAVKPQEWTEDIRAHNAAIDKAERLAVLERFADALQRVPGRHVQRRALHHVSADVSSLGLDWQATSWVQLYFDCETAQLWSHRINVTGLGKAMPRLAPMEIEDAREASKLASAIQAKERRLFRPTSGNESDLRDVIIASLGGWSTILEQCGGNVDLADQAIAKARPFFAGDPSCPSQ